MADSAVVPARRGASALLIGALLFILAAVGCIVFSVLRGSASVPSTVTPTVTAALAVLPTLTWAPEPLPPTATPPLPTNTVPPPPIPPTATFAPPPPTAPAPVTATPQVALQGLPPECWYVYLNHASVATTQPVVAVYPPNTQVAAGTQPLSWALEPVQNVLGVANALALKPTLQGRTTRGQPYYSIPVDTTSAIFLRGAIYRGDLQANPTTEGLCWKGDGWMRVRVPGRGIPDPAVGR